MVWAHIHVHARADSFMFVTEMFTHECTWGIHSGVGRDKTCHLQSLLVAVDASMAMQYD